MWASKNNKFNHQALTCLQKPDLVSSYSAERKNVNEAIEPPKNGKNDDEELESDHTVSDVQYSAAGDVSAGIDNTSAEDITHEKRSTEERKYSSSALSG